MSIFAIIPARFGSTRFPGKPLADRTGKPLIQHVVEQTRQASRVARVVVATDDVRIADAVTAFGGEVVMTRSDHPNGTSRLAEAVDQIAPRPATAHRANDVGINTPVSSAADGKPKKTEAEPIILNVQGDEPEIEPALIDKLVECLEADPHAPMATLASPFAADDNPANPNIVKVVTGEVDGRRRALYFSRSVIPYVRETDRPGGEPFAGCLKHAGLYAYRRDFLMRYITLPATPLEQAEQLEQLRALEHGYPIAIVIAPFRHTGIDTPEQYEAFVQRWRHGQG